MSADRGSSTATDILFVTFFVSFLIFGTWFVGRDLIMWVSFYCSYYLFGVYLHVPWLMSSTEFSSIKTAYNAIPHLNPTDYGIKALMVLFEQHGYVGRWFAVPLLLWLGWRTKKGVVRFKYRREIKDVYDLIDIQAKHFPASAIIKGKNLLAMHPYIGPWKTYALPLDFALDNKLLWASKKVVTADDAVNEKNMVPLRKFTPDEKLQPFPVKRKMIPHFRYVSYSIERANQIFADQMGPLWNGHEELPPLEKALYAIFITHANGQQAEAWKMICQVAFSFKEATYDKDGQMLTPHIANTKGVDELITKYGKHPKIKEITNTHAHRYNVLIALLTWARSKGRIYHANIGWIRPVNNTLFFAIENEGGQCSFWEAAGPWAHAQIERKQRKKIVVPTVPGAVLALEELLSKEHWIDPGIHSEEAQQRLVKEANDLLAAEVERAKADQKQQQRDKRPGPPQNVKRAVDQPKKLDDEP